MGDIDMLMYNRGTRVRVGAGDSTSSILIEYKRIAFEGSKVKK
jgi:hypothetical protein